MLSAGSEQRRRRVLGCSRPTRSPGRELLRTQTRASLKYPRLEQPTLRLARCARMPLYLCTILSMSGSLAQPPRFLPTRDSGRPLLLHSLRGQPRLDLAPRATKCRLVLIREHENTLE